MDTYDSPRSSVPARMPASRGPASLAPRFGSPQPESAPSPISIRVALRGARRYWWLVLALWAVGSAGIGAVIYKKVQPQFRAESLLRVEPSTKALYDASGTENIEAFLQTQVDLIKSANILTAAGTAPEAARLERIQTAGDVVLELRRAIIVAIRPGTYLIEVSMQSPSAIEAATLVNAVVRAFNESNVEWSNGQTRNQIKNLETYLGELKNQSTELERQWKDIVARGGGSTVVSVMPQAKATSKVAAEPAAGGEQSLTVDHFLQLQKDKLDITVRISEVEQSIAEAKRVEQQGPRGGESSSLNPERINAAINSRIAADAELNSIKAQMLAAKSKVDKVKRAARQGGDPAEREALRSYDSWNSKFREEYASRSARIREELESPAGVAGDPDREIRELEAEHSKLKFRKTAIDEQLAKLEVKKGKQATDDVEIQLIIQHHSDLAGMQESVLRRLEQMKYESRGENRIRTVQDAVAPGKPISDKRMTYLAVTPVGILAAVLGLIVLLEIRSGRVADPDLLSSRVRHEVFSIAPLPALRPGEDASGDKAEQRLARFVQSLDHLRVALCEGGIPGEGRCVMITSATGGEGKTTLSAHLAARCANAGTTTLLIDADMRRASLGRLLDVPAGPGLGDVLAGDAELDDVLITVQAGGFHFLSAGLPGRDPSRVLRSTRLAELIGRLRQTYDLVIIDTPPILPVADALIMGRWADGAVMAARYDASRLPLVERANRQLAVAGIPVLGVVVNGVRGQNANYGNYAYSYNYPGRTEAAEESPSA